MNLNTQIAFTVTSNITSTFCVDSWCSTAWPSVGHAVESKENQIYVFPEQRFNEWCGDPWCSEAWFNPEEQRELHNQFEQLENLTHEVKQQYGLNVLYDVSSQLITEISKTTDIKNQFNSFKLTNFESQGTFSIDETHNIENQYLSSILNTNRDSNNQFTTSIESSRELNLQGTFSISKVHNIEQQYNSSRLRYINNSFVVEVFSSRHFENQYNSVKLFNIEAQYTSLISSTSSLSGQALTSISSSLGFNAQFISSIRADSSFVWCGHAWCSYPWPTSYPISSFSSQFEVSSIKEKTLLSQFNSNKLRNLESQLNTSISVYNILNNQLNSQRLKEMLVQFNSNISSMHELSNSYLSEINTKKDIFNQYNTSIATTKDVNIQIDFSINGSYSINNQSNFYAVKYIDNQIDVNISTLHLLDSQINFYRYEDRYSQYISEIQDYKDINNQITFSIIDDYAIENQFVSSIFFNGLDGFCSDSWCSGSWCSDYEKIGSPILNQFVAAPKGEHNLNNQSTFFRYEDSNYQISFSIGNINALNEQAYFESIHRITMQSTFATQGSRHLNNQWGLNVDTFFFNQFQNSVRTAETRNTQYYYDSPTFTFGDSNGEWCSSEEWPSTVWAYTSLTGYNLKSQMLVAVQDDKTHSNQILISVDGLRNLNTQYFFETQELKDYGYQCRFYIGTIRRFSIVYENQINFLIPKRLYSEYRTRPF